MLHGQQPLVDKLHAWSQNCDRNKDLFPSMFLLLLLEDVMETTRRASDYDPVLTLLRLSYVLRMAHHDPLQLFQNILFVGPILQIHSCTLLSPLLPMSVPELLASFRVDSKV